MSLKDHKSIQLVPEMQYLDHAFANVPVHCFQSDEHFFPLKINTAFFFAQEYFFVVDYSLCSVTLSCWSADFDHLFP